MEKKRNRQYCASPHRICPDKPFLEFKKAEINQSIIDRFERQVTRYPSRLAVKTEKAQLTYAELNQAANRIARAIIERRGQANEPVALFFDQGVQLISAMFAVLKAGKSYIALDTSFPPSKNLSLVKHCRPGLILTGRDHYHTVRKLFENAPPLLNIDEAGPLYSPENLDLPVSPEATAYIIYTSGSTGEPKGVFQNHQNVLHNVMRCTNMLHIAADDRLSLLWSCSFAASVPNIFGALLNGAALFPHDLKKKGIINLADWLIKEEITIYHSVPTVYRHLLSTLTGRENFSRLRLIKLSGEPVRMRDVELYRKHFHEGCLFHVSYASTETNIVRQFFCDHHTPLSGDIVPAGYEVEDMQVLVLDEDGKEAAANCAGEIAVRSPYLPPAYFRKEGLAESPFIPDKEGNCRTYRTGDLGYMLPDGCLIHLGRKDQQLKIRGYRVEIGEIEAALSELAGIKEAAVAGRDDQYNGKFLVAYIVPRKGKAVKAGRLRSALKDRLPDYMVPSRFVFLEGLPLTLSGKVDRRALPSPGPEQPELEKNYVAPGTPAEEMLAGIWSSILGTKSVGVSDNFFELGGHSLLVARMASEIKKVTGKTLTAAAIFQSPTIKQLAEVLQKRGPQSKFPSILRLSGGRGTPLFWVGFNAFLPRYLDYKGPLYEILLRGDFEKAGYNSVEELAAHHLNEIQAVQPKGPYLLGGYCFYGLVALEMAQRLIERGEEVPLLCLVEPPPQCLPLTGSGKASSESDISFGSRVKFHGAKLLRSEDESILYRIRRRIKRDASTALCNTSLLFGFHVPWRFLEVHKVNTARKYTPRAYPGRVVVFLTDKAYGNQPDWSGFASTHVHEVPGAKHLTIHEEPYVSIWARQLNHYLNGIGNERTNDRAWEMVSS